MTGETLWQLEHSFYTDEIAVICGVDEAGRGPLAGPVYAAAVILPRDWILPGLNDSKKVPDKRRRELYDQIVDGALAFGIGSASAGEIDELNILQATFLAMKRAVSQLQTKPDLILVDGNQEPQLDVPVRTIVKGDGKSANIAAASILAKVSRDRYMEAMGEQSPQYDFAIHKGYGTKRHYEALRTYGPCPIHRMSFLKKFYAGQP